MQGTAVCRPLLNKTHEGEECMKNYFAAKLGPNLYKYYAQIMMFILCVVFITPTALATSSPAPGSTNDMWKLADTIIRDVYGKIAGISTVLAGLMSAVAVIGAKMSNNQHKVDQAWDWLRRIWIAWAVVNGIGAFLAYIRPLFAGYNTIS